MASERPPQKSCQFSASASPRSSVGICAKFVLEERPQARSLRASMCFPGRSLLVAGSSSRVTTRGAPQAGLVRFTQDEHGLYVASKNHDSRPPPEMGVFAPRGASPAQRPPAWSPAQPPHAWSPAQRPPAWSPAQPPHSQRPTGIYSTIPRSPPADGRARTTSGSHFQWTPSARRGLHTARTLTHIHSLWADALPLPEANSAQASSSKSSSDIKAYLPTVPEPCHNRAGKLDRTLQAPTVQHLRTSALGLSLLRSRTEMQQTWSLLRALHAVPRGPAPKFPLPLSTTLPSQTAVLPTRTF
ncbi:hypothetical protein EXIGLDRAFT_434310 [Exidia glandulosa HHB12029]|uniref:Uncharacterized protein n=1 Tax=Exidia glandulosa HHB12029 TaxID=1314781 RepID=A0A165B9I3_EXIGL|nr:hypothetical protein EXIGLDRAFT_434310 [Exidia glandulosa HHB12029]